MKRIIAPVLMALAFAAAAPGAVAEEFTGDVKYACEAIMCLSTGNRPDECQPSLERYFSISAKRVSDTIKKRKGFLELCPAADDSEDMEKLVDDLANGAGRCDANTLNQELRAGKFGYVSNRLPEHCAAYAGNGNTDGAVARYVGVPGRGGRWVDAQDYERARQQYEQQQSANDWRYGSGGGSQGTGGAAAEQLR